MLPCAVWIMIIMVELGGKRPNLAMLTEVDQYTC